MLPSINNQTSVHHYTLSHTCRVSGGKKPSDCIQLIHDEYLKRICQESGFQGLKYHGGPMLPCLCSEPSVFTFVTFDALHNSKLLLRCPKCNTEWKKNGEETPSGKIIITRNSIICLYFSRCLVYMII